MNRNLHRIIFNAARGTRMVVQESARSAGKAPGSSRGTLGLALAVLIGAGSAYGQIHGDPNAPGIHRPQVLAAPNGVPLVNITTPSAAGVSRNIYSRFDVQSDGAILNNSRSNVQTQMGGYVQGNPWLAKGSARVILNEVNSGNPTQLRGYVEVAGQRAEVIVANPAGIAVSGGGFINASRATLTTGVPQLDAAGGIDGFAVRGGTVSIDGAGLDAADTDYAAILARAAQVNAGIWANELRIATGANRISGDHGEASPTADGGAPPGFALDVAAIGGMYANKITLIGTEAGLGVRNAGTIRAAPGGEGALAGVGQLRVTSAGRLENSGSIEVTQDAHIEVAALANTGRIASAAQLRLEASDELANTAGGLIEAKRMELASAGAIDNRGGTVRQTSDARLQLQAPRLSNTDGGMIGPEPARPDTKPDGDKGGGNGTPAERPSGGPDSAPPGGDTTAGGGSGDVADGNEGTPLPAGPPPPGILRAGTEILNDGGGIHAGGEIELDTPQIDNSGGRIEVSTLAISGPAFSNVDGKLTIRDGFRAEVGRFDNSGGELNAGSVQVDALENFLNRNGRIASNGDVVIRVGGNLDNADGSISAVGEAAIEIAGAINNQAGQVVANRDLRVAGRSLDNAQGAIHSAQANSRLDLTGHMVNAGGAIGAADDLLLRAGSLSNSGNLRAGRDASLQVAGHFESDGNATTGRDLGISAGSLRAGATSVLGAGVQDDARLAGGGDLRVSVEGDLVANGTLIAAGNAALQGAGVDLSSSQASASNIAIEATRGDVRTSGATIATPGVLSVDADALPAQTLVNESGVLSAGALDLRVSNLANTKGGEIVQTGSGALTIAVSGELDNSGGRIAGNAEEMKLQAARFQNHVGRIEHAGKGTLSLSGGSFAGDNGILLSNGTLDTTLSGAFEQNGGSVRAQQVSIDAGAIGNRGGEIVQIGEGPTRIVARDLLDNAGGRIATNGRDAMLSAGRFDNTGGAIEHAGNGSLALSAEIFDGANGRLIGNGSLDIEAGSFYQRGGSMAAQQIRITASDLDNRSGEITQLGSGTTQIRVANSFDNTAGRLATNGEGLRLQMSGAALLNSEGSIEHAGSGSLALDVGRYAAVGGQVVSNGALSVQAGSYEQQGGQTLAQQIEIDAAELVNIDGAEIVQAGTGRTRITASRLLDNDGGRIGSNGAEMDLLAADITNRGGSIQHAGSGTLALQASSFDGTAGELVSNGTLAARAGRFVQDAGAISAHRIDMDVASLGNRGGRIIQTGKEAGRIAVAGAVDNRDDGAIASNAHLSLKAGELSNQGGSVRTGEGAKLELQVDGLLDNQDGEIGAGGDAALTAGRLKNDGGIVTAIGDLNVRVGGAVSNLGGTLAANGSTAIASASLDNSGGVVAAVKGSLGVTTDQSTINASGSLQAGGDVRLVNGGFDNAAGKVFGNRVLLDTAGAALTNAAGTLAAADSLDIRSGALTNDAGVIQSGGAMSIDSQAVANTHGGMVFSQGALSVGTRAGEYDNGGGRTLSVGDLSIESAGVINAGGLIRSAGTTTIAADSVDNTATLGDELGIEGKKVAIDAGSLQNNGGAIRADEDLLITSGGTVDNSGGLVSAGGSLRITDPEASGTSSKTLVLVNTEGTLEAGQSLQIDAASFSGDGRIASGEDLSIALAQDLVNNGELIAKGDLSYVTIGHLVNNGKLVAGGLLTAGGSVVDNNAGAEMSGRDALIQAGVLNNQGLIDSHGQTRIDAGSVNNVQSGRIYGGDVAIGAGELNNSDGATVAARFRLDIGAGTINNSEHALLFSAGEMHIGGALDAGGRAVGNGGVLNNLSATVESLGDMSIAMGTVNNRDVHLTVTQTTSVKESNYLATTADGRIWSYQDTRGDPFSGLVYHRNPDGSESIVGQGYGDWHITETTTGDVASNVDPARIVAGGSLRIDGHLSNQDSKVLAGGTLQVGSVDNRVTEGTAITRYQGYVDGYDGHGVARFTPHIPDSPPMTVALGGFEYRQNVNETGGYDSGSAPDANAPGVSAGGAGQVSGGSGGGTIVEVPSAVDGGEPIDGRSADALAGGRAGNVEGAEARAASGQGAADAVGASSNARAGGSAKTPRVVRTSSPDLAVPGASLFTARADSGNGYLIETDPRFANYRQWLSSDYLLSALGRDPERVLKRLGDGFYEQKLIREQVAQLTGYRYLEGFDDDEAQYAALMSAGATFAQKYGLAPGIALSAAQMAQLTSDIVWLVEQTVTLPDGSTQRVLAPQVYVRVQPGDIDGSGALLSGERVVVKSGPGGGDMSNSGSIAGRSLVSISADNVNNLGGRISGGSVVVNAAKDINNIGGVIDARNSAVLTAGRDLNIQTTTQTNASGGSRIDRVASVYVSDPGGVLIASAGRDVNLIAGMVGSAGAAAVGAGRDIRLGTVTESIRMSATGDGAVGTLSRSREIGSAIVAQGDIRLAAGNDLNIRAGAVASADGALIASAGNNINLTAGEASVEHSTATVSSSKNLLRKSSTSTFDSTSVPMCCPAA